MSDTTPAKPLPAQMLDLITGYWVSKMVFVAARLGIADQLRDGARSADDLAAAVGVQPQRLHRLLRALASVGVFAADANGHFGLSPLAETLRSDRPDSMRDFALMMTDSFNWDAWDMLGGGIESESTPFETAFGKGFFGYLAEHPEDEAVFARSMASISAMENPAIAAALDLSGVGTLVDVGGSAGHLLATVLRHHEGVRGTLFDLPQIVEKAKAGPFLTDPAIAPRVAFAAGDFFKAVPKGADAYMMKYVLHDWNDDQCVQILTHCREAMAPGGRVFAVDSVIAAGNDAQWGKLLDINMLVLTGGRERTEAEFGELFYRAGLHVERVIATQCPLGIVVGKAR